MKRILVLTSGGDAPGMNMALRAIVREASFNDIEVYAAYEGYKGLVEGNILPLTNRDIAGSLQLGGTLLGSSRYPKFKEKPYVMKAYHNLKHRGVDGVIVIGGNGSLTGGRSLVEETGLPVVGIPASIDNDLYGTDMALGVDTALNTIVYNVDKIRDTAASHRRLFVIEVMGRDCGYLALLSGMACGALSVLIPEIQEEFKMEHLEHLVYKAFLRAKKHTILLKAEGFNAYSDDVIQERLSQTLTEKGLPDLDMRFTKLGHIQRGGAPTAFDRVLANKMGTNAVRYLMQGQSNIMVGLIENKMTTVPLSDIGQGKRDRVMHLYKEYIGQEFLMTKKLTPNQ